MLASGPPTISSTLSHATAVLPNAPACGGYTSPVEPLRDASARMPTGLPQPSQASPAGESFFWGAASVVNMPQGAEDILEEIAQTLSLLAPLFKGPSVPPLPPSGCYGELHISSVVSEGLGAEAAQAAQQAANELGERPVKVMLPWYPAHPGPVVLDQTMPAKLTITIGAGGNVPLLCSTEA